MRKTKKGIASVFASALMAIAVVAPASAAQQQQNGLVNVAIGDITIQDVSVGVAANVAANVCGTDFLDVLVLARQTDRTGTATTVCTTGDQVVRFTQD
jgi:hypothetical protein